MVASGGAKMQEEWRLEIARILNMEAAGINERHLSGGSEVNVDRGSNWAFIQCLFPSMRKMTLVLSSRISNKEVLYSRKVECSGLAPTELLQCFNEREPCDPDSPLQGALAAQASLNIGKGLKVVHIGSALFGSLIGEALKVGR
jgi:hypothetical protein